MCQYNIAYKSNLKIDPGPDHCCCIADMCVICNALLIQVNQQIHWNENNFKTI